MRILLKVLLFPLTLFLPLLLPVFRHGIEHRSNGVVSLGAGIAFLR